MLLVLLTEQSLPPTYPTYYVKRVYGNTEMPAQRLRRAYRNARRRTAQVAAGTVGFIAGNLPGAYIGWEAAGRGMARRYRRRKAPGGGVTSQYDTTQVYRRKRMPRFKRKQWKKFTRKVKAAISDRGTCTIVLNGAHAQQQPATVGTVQKQSIMFAHLYGKQGVGAQPNEIGANDLNKVVSSIRGTIHPTVDDTTKFHFKSAVLDITVTNQIAAEGQYTGPLEVDVYHIVYPTKKTVVIPGLGDAFNGGTIQTEIIDALPKIEINDRGVTPFAIGQAISVVGLKILSKKKYFLPYGQCFTHQIRDPKNRTIDSETLVDKNTFYQPGWTQTLMMIAKPTAVIGENQIFNLICGATRSFVLDWEGLNEDKSKYYSNTV